MSAISSVASKFNPHQPGKVNQAKCQSLATELFQRVNRYRQVCGKAPLKLVPIASGCAQQHSRQMAAGKHPFGHFNHQARLGAIAQATGVIIKAAGENVDKKIGVSNPAQAAFRTFKNTNIANQNMLGDFNRTGIGVGIDNQGRYYFTQIFFKV